MSFTQGNELHTLYFIVEDTNCLNAAQKMDYLTIPLLSYLACLLIIPYMITIDCSNLIV